MTNEYPLDTQTNFPYRSLRLQPYPLQEAPNVPPIRDTTVRQLDSDRTNIGKGFGRE